MTVKNADTSTTESVDDDLGVAIEDKYPWRDEETLQTLYVDRDWTQAEIADLLGCEAATISYWLGRFDLRRERDGVSFFRTSYDSENAYRAFQIDRRTVTVHQLLACVDHDPYEVFDSTNHVHHRNGVRFDNRRENIEVVSTEEHGSIHADGVFQSVDGEPRLVADGGGAEA